MEKNASGESEPPKFAPSLATPVPPSFAIPAPGGKLSIFERSSSFGPPYSLMPSRAPGLDPVRSLPPRSVLPTGMTALERDLIRKLRTGGAALPLLPNVVERALELAKDPEARGDQLARLLKNDLPLAARFLSAAGSVAYWRGSTTESTESAIARLGLTNTRDLLFHAVHASAASGFKKFQSPVSRSFKRSVVAAIACRMAAPVLNISGDYDYLTGLLHDVGEIRVYRVLEGLSTSPADADLVRSLVERYHASAGAELVEKWKLPSEIVDACGAHHVEGQAENVYTRLARVADAIVSVLEAQTLGNESSRAASDGLGLSREVFRSLVEKTRHGVGSRLSVPA